MSSTTANDYAELQRQLAEAQKKVTTLEERKRKRKPVLECDQCKHINAKGLPCQMRGDKEKYDGRCSGYSEGNLTRLPANRNERKEPDEDRPMYPSTKNDGTHAPMLKDSYTRIMYDTGPMYINRKEMLPFNDCNLEEYNLPFIEMSVVDVKTPSTPKKVSEIVTKMWGKGYRFFKTCYMSPKDVSNNKHPTSVDEVVNWFIQSNRTQNLWTGELQSVHIVGKKWCAYINEYRCFFYNDHPRLVVSHTDDHTGVIEFFKTHRYDIPEQCCIELGELEDGNLKVIEMNYFGKDGVCDPEPLSWQENEYELTMGSTIFYTL
jgi:hypothetical protein